MEDEFPANENELIYSKGAGRRRKLVAGEQARMKNVMFFIIFRFSFVCFSPTKRSAVRECVNKQPSERNKDGNVDYEL